LVSFSFLIFNPEIIFKLFPLKRHWVNKAEIKEFHSIIDFDEYLNFEKNFEKELKLAFNEAVGISYRLKNQKFLKSLGF
jgi:hypothetical protein